MVATRGIPDLIICVNGKFVAWELKVKKNKATKLQEHNLNKIREAKGVALVITPDNFTYHYSIIDRLANTSSHEL